MFKSCVMLVLLSAVALAARPGIAGAQSRPQVTLDMGAGVGREYGGGDRDTRTGVAASAQFTLTVRTLSTTSLLVGVHVGTQRIIDGSDDCLVRLTNPAGGCVPNCPDVQWVSAAVGWATRGHGTTVRALVGPAAIRSDGAVRPGVQGRVDVATLRVAHAALVPWIESTIVPRLRGDSYLLASAGLAIRLQ